MNFVQFPVFQCFCTGGSLTVQDLASYRVTVTDAWVVPLGEYKMYIPPPPAGGVILSFILNLMKGACCGRSSTLSNHIIKLVYVLNREIQINTFIVCCMWAHRWGEYEGLMQGKLNNCFYLQDTTWIQHHWSGKGHCFIIALLKLLSFPMD